MKRNINLPGWRLAAIAVTVLGIALRVAEFSPLSTVHPDEIFQYLEQGERIATGHAILTWEYFYGVRNALIPQFLAPWIWLGHRLFPGTLMHVYLARAAFAAIGLLLLPAAWRLGALTSRAHALVALTVAATWWECVVFDELLLSGSAAATVILFASAPLLRMAEPGDPHPQPGLCQRPAAMVLATSGLLLGIGVLLRLQYAPFAAVLLVWAAVRQGRHGWHTLKPVAGGLFAACLAGAISDGCSGHIPYYWVWANIDLNIGRGIAARFGEQGPSFYLSMLRAHLSPVALPVVALGCFASLQSPRRYLPLLVAAGVTLLVHSAIGHKEYRFIWIVTLTLLLLAAMGSLDLARWIAAKARSHVQGAPGRLMLGLLISGWVALSAFSAHRARFVRDTQPDGAQVVKLANQASKRPGICAIAMDKQLVRWVIPDLIAAPTHLLLAPEDDPRFVRRVPQAVLNGANAVISMRKLMLAPTYRKIRCVHSWRGPICLYVRPGSCQATNGHWDIQATLNRDASAQLGLAIPPTAEGR